MEKRAILACVLSLLIFVGWAKLYGPQTNIPTQNNEIISEQQKAPESDAGNAVVAPEISPAVSSVEAPLPVTADSVKEKTVIVETPFYIATLSNRGPSISGFKLKKYKETLDENSGPVELFTAQNIAKKHISLHFNSLLLKNGNDLTYTTDEESLVLKEGQGGRDLIFKYSTPEGIAIEQIYSFSSEGYDIGLEVKISNQSGNPVSGDIEAVINNMHPEGKTKFYSFIGTSAYVDNELLELDSGDLEDEDDTDKEGKIDWIAYENEYFISAVLPEEKNERKFKGRINTEGLITATLFSPRLEVPPSTGVSKKYILYLGPRDIGILKNFGHKLGKAIDFGFFDIIAKPLHGMLKFFNGFVKNYGISIILLTIIIKILFWPLTHKSQKSMKEMQKLQPLMAKIREKYKNDREAMNRELMGLYRTYKVNPMSGCLPMLIQIPVFFALYRVLGSSIELRHAPFMLWITDLSAPDRLFSLPFGIPFMDAPYGIPVLTLLMGASMFITQKMQPMVGDPSQAKVMMFLPIMFTVMFINFPSGLVLYWLTQNILSIGQQYRINKKSD